MDTDWLLGQFGSNSKQAAMSYQNFVMQGRGIESPLMNTRHQLILGDDNFVEQHYRPTKNQELRELSIAHRRVLALPISEYTKLYPDRNEAMVNAYRSGAYTMAQIADYFSVHYMH
jgi:hypothetical protein